MICKKGKLHPRKGHESPEGNIVIGIHLSARWR